MFPFSDIAVSAPYEGNGVVYIYHSMADGDGLNLESVQVGQIVSRTCDVGGGGCPAGLVTASSMYCACLWL